MTAREHKPRYTSMESLLTSLVQREDALIPTGMMCVSEETRFVFAISVYSKIYRAGNKEIIEKKSSLKT